MSKVKTNKEFLNEDFLKNISSLEQPAIIERMELTQFGLTDDQFEERFKKYGKNETDKNSFKWFNVFLKSFFGPFNLILIVISIYNFASYFTYSFWQEDKKIIFDLIGAIIVALMVFISGGMSFIQELRSHLVTKKISSIVKSTTNIIRHKNDKKLNNFKIIDKSNQLDLIRLGEEIEISELVPGDLIYLSSGDLIPADIRLIQSNDLFINQSSLTGESLPVEKHSTNSIWNSNNILDLENICYTGTSVVSGSAIAIVVATGNNTYFSTISKAISKKRPESAFFKGIKKVTRILLLFMLIMIPLVYFANALPGQIKIWTHSLDIISIKENPWFKALFFAIAVAVGLTPEMLPMIVTTNLSVGASKMSTQKVVVKELQAIQSLGAIDILCTDKTGTLTNDKIELINYLTLDKKQDQRLLKYLYINSSFQTGLKNPMDKSVIKYITDNIIDFNLDDISKIDEIPFDFNRRKLTIISKLEDQSVVMITKGSIEEILESCNFVYYKDKKEKLTNDLKRQIVAHYNKNNSQGKRVLGIAYKEITNGQTIFTSKDEVDLTFFGFASFLDTPKPSTEKMIKLLKKYGVDLKILTGDNEQVTRAICNMVKLDIKGVISGDEIDRYSDEELKVLVEKTNLFVKLNPLQKVKIIQILKSNDHIVGYMGDGINDAPVLRQSDVAISVNNATDIAKDASDIILLEKSLLVLEKGIIQGRTIFGNILKYIKITIASNFGNVLSLLIAAVLLPFTPMAPTQILFQNLIYDISQFAIAVDNVDQSFIQRPQKWTTKDFIPFSVINGFVSSLFDIITFVIVGYGLHTISEFEKGSTIAVQQFQAAWFFIGLCSQILAFHVLRTEKIPLIQSKSNWVVYGTSISVFIVTTLVVFINQIRINSWLEMISPGWIFIPIAIAILISYCALAQLVKMLYIKIYKKWL